MVHVIHPAKEPLYLCNTIIPLLALLWWMLQNSSTGGLLIVIVLPMFDDENFMIIDVNDLMLPECYNYISPFMFPNKEILILIF